MALVQWVRPSAEGVDLVGGSPSSCCCFYRYMPMDLQGTAVVGKMSVVAVVEGA